MITFTAGYKTSDGQIVTDLKTAKVLELVTLLKLDGSKLAEVMVEKADAVVDILTTKTTSRPRARKINGAKRTRKPAAPPAPPAPIMDEEDVAAASRPPGAIVEDDDLV